MKKDKTEIFQRIDVKILVNNQNFRQAEPHVKITTPNWCCNFYEVGSPSLKYLLFYPLLLAAAIFAAITFANELLSDVREGETDYRTNHWENAVSAKCKHSLPKELAKVLTTSWEDLIHQSNSWVDHEVILQAQEA